MPIDSLNFLLQSDTELLVSEMQKIGVTSFVSETKCVETYPDFEKIQLVRIVQNGLQGFIVKNNNNGESTEKQSWSYFVEVGLLHK